MGGLSYRNFAHCTTVCHDLISRHSPKPGATSVDHTQYPLSRWKAVVYPVPCIPTGKTCVMVSWSPLITEATNAEFINASVLTHLLNEISHKDPKLKATWKAGTLINVPEVFNRNILCRVLFGINEFRPTKADIRQKLVQVDFGVSRHHSSRYELGHQHTLVNQIFLFGTSI